MIGHRYLFVLLLSFGAVACPADAAGPAISPQQIARGLSQAFIDASASITPSLVSITVVGVRPSPSPSPSGSPPPYTPFSGDADQTPEGLGTGFIISQDGYIVTNNHVVAHAREITVRLHDHTRLKAELVGASREADLAVLRIQHPNLVPVAFSDSDKLQIGEWVVAAGNPLGLEESITAGIVSAKRRTFVGAPSLGEFIQTDAAINPGNSGGPLIDLDGKVVGINTAIFSRSGGYMGIGFAIPINRARGIVEQLIKGETYPMPSQGKDSPILQRLGLTLTNEAAVAELSDGSLAQAAGLQKGDKIVAVNEHTVNSREEVVTQVSEEALRIGVAIHVEREGRRRSFKVRMR